MILGVPPRERLLGSAAATAIAVANGASIVRAHDVKETRQAVRVAHAIGHPEPASPHEDG